MRLLFGRVSLFSLFLSKTPSYLVFSLPKKFQNHLVKFPETLS